MTRPPIGARNGGLGRLGVNKVGGNRNMVRRGYSTKL